MVVVLILAVLFPPWETPPTQTPEFLGMYFILSPPAPEAVVSRMLLTIELVTIAIAGLYGAFLFRKKDEEGPFDAIGALLLWGSLFGSYSYVVSKLLH